MAVMKFTKTLNILRFNLHWYMMTLLILFCLCVLAVNVDEGWRTLTWFLFAFIIIVAAIPLVISWYIYDYTNLYELNFLEEKKEAEGLVVNIHSGYDETTPILQKKFPDREILIFDFYHPDNQTEPSIKTARKLYPPSPAALSISTSQLPLPPDSASLILLFFAAHEIRKEDERLTFFKELYRVISPEGRIVVVEHLRDGYNFLAYNIGFFHFVSRQNWMEAIDKSGLQVHSSDKHTPFITLFKLIKK